MKILIMVLTFNEPPYAELKRSQQATWDSIQEGGVETIYYAGGFDGYNELPHRDFMSYQEPPKPWSTEVRFRCTDSYYYMAEKFQKALEYVKDYDYDIIFRTNSSSYVNKKRLKEFAATLPKEKLYAGWTMVDSEDHGGLVVSGAGIFMSHDTAEILRENIDPKFEQEEDIYCGRILRKHGITASDDKSRYDVPTQFENIPLDRYHYRFKTGDRLWDAKNMRLVHQKIISA